MVMGYGQDDRICAFTSLLAQLESEDPLYTSVCLLTDGAYRTTNVYSAGSMVPVSILSKCRIDLSTVFPET